MFAQVKDQMHDVELSYRVASVLVAIENSDVALEMLEALSARYFRIDSGVNWDPDHLYW